MRSKWGHEALGCAGVRVLDCVHKTPADSGLGYPYLAIPNIKDGRIQLEGVRRISEADFVSWTSRYKPMAGDVIVTRRARVGDTAPIPENLECAIGQNLVLLRSNGAAVDKAYLRWACQGPLWRAEVDRLRNVGAVFDSLNVSDIPKIRIPLPPLFVQRRIAEVLGSLDDLIQINQRLADSLAELRRCLSATTLNETRTLKPLSSVARFINGKNFTKDAAGVGLPVIRTPEVRSGPNSATVRNSVEANVDQVARCGNILFVWSGSLLVDRWIYEDGLVNQHIFKVVPEPGFPDWLLFALIEYQMPWFLGLASDKATTMGHIQRVHLDAEVPIPDDQTLKQLGSIIQPIWDEELAARVEVQILSRTRDELLPLLMSGRVSVREAAA